MGEKEERGDEHYILNNTTLKLLSMCHSLAEVE